MMDKAEKSANENLVGRLHGWDDEKVYFWSPETGEQCISDEPVLLNQLVAICVEYFQGRSTQGNR
jgi:hypothetical protein